MGTLRAAGSYVPENRDAAGVTARGLEESGCVPKRIFIFVGLQHLMSVSPPRGLHLHESFTSDRDHHPGAMGRIVHGRETMPSRWKTTLIKHQGDQSLVVILRLRIENAPKLSL